jgi:glutathione S-transferase
MLLIGMFDSPFVRRVAVTMKLLDLRFLFESAAILDYLDELVGAERALMPASGPDRRQALNLIAMATGAAEKGVLQHYERVFRPESKRHQPWMDRLRLQMNASLAALDRHISDRGVAQWLVGKRMTQADITAVCAFTFLNDSLRVASDAAMFSSLATLAARCEAMAEFSETRVPFSAPGS